VSPVKYELGFYIPKGTILHSHSNENLRSFMVKNVFRKYRWKNSWATILTFH
jgi:hypothetical protein